MLSRPLAIIAAIAGLVGLGIDGWVFAAFLTPSATAPARGVLDLLVYYWTFLTHLSNLGLLLVYLSTAVGWRWLGWFRQPVTRAGLAGIIALVMVFFHVMLAPHYSFAGPVVVSNFLLHTVTPLAYLAWWLLGAHDEIRLRDVPVMIIPGLAYVAWALLRGLVVGEYPYTILDPTFALPGGQAQGYLGVAIGVAVILILVALFDMGLVLVDAFLARRSGKASGG